MITNIKINISQWDIVHVDLGALDGSSLQKGLRPCVVVSNNMSCRCSPVIQVVPLTTRPKRHLPTHTTITTAKISSTFLGEQILSIQCNTQLRERIGTLSAGEIEAAKNCLRIQLAM